MFGGVNAESRAGRTIDDQLSTLFILGLPLSILPSTCRIFYGWGAGGGGDIAAALTAAVEKNSLLDDV